MADIILSGGFLKSRTCFQLGSSYSVQSFTQLVSNVFDGGVTSALYETLRRLAYHVTDGIHAKQLLQRLEKVRN